MVGKDAFYLKIVTIATFDFITVENTVKLPIVSEVLI